MYSWTVGRFVRLAYRRAIAGDVGLMMLATSPDVSFRFPGKSSFGAQLLGREALRDWLSRFTALEPRFEIHDVLVSGPPWNMRVALRFSDAIGNDYRNDGVEWVHLRWGRVRAIEVFLDTERIEAWEGRSYAR